MATIKEEGMTAMVVKEVDLAIMEVEEVMEVEEEEEDMVRKRNHSQRSIFIING